MAVRFSKRIKIAPGVKFNISKSGISTTVGVKGASVNLGKKGVFLNTSIPGTGLSSRDRIGRTSSTTSAQNPSKVLWVGLGIIVALAVLALIVF